MTQGRSYQAYQNTGVQTANQQKLIVMLYDGINRFLSQSIQSIESLDLEAAHKQLSKANKIVLELLNTLRDDKGGELAANLKQLYLYSYEKLVIANLKKDIQAIEEVREVMNILREGWCGVGQNEKQTVAPKSTEPMKLRVTG